MNDGDRKITMAMQEAARMELALTVPNEVLGPIMANIMSRGTDEVIAIINTAEKPGGTDDIRDSLLTIVRRDVLAEALGNSVPQLERRKVGHIPFIVIDRHGTTVVMIAAPTLTNAPGGSA